MNLKKRIFSSIILFALIFPVSLFAEQFQVVVESEVKAVISAEREGMLSLLKAREGDYLKKDQLIAQVYHEDLLLRKEQREAKQRYLTVQVENLTKLHEKGLITDEELERAKMEMQVNDTEMRIIEAEIRRSRILAPFSGRVIARHMHPHEWVRPGQPIIEMIDPNQLRIVGDVRADIGLKLKEGRVDSLYFPALEKKVDVKIDVILGNVDIRSNTVKIIWGVGREARKQGLVPGMKGEVRFGAQ